MEYSAILIPLFVLVVMFFLLKELKSWYMKINEKISQLEKQNTILWSLILGANAIDEIKNEMLSMRPPESPIPNEHSSPLSARRRQHFN